MSQILNDLLNSYKNSGKPALDRRVLACWLIFRPASWLPTTAFIATGWSANAVTLLAASLLPIIWGLLLSGDWNLAKAGYVLFFCFTLLDYVDGNIARYRKTNSVFGKTLDGFVDQLASATYIFVACGNIRLHAHLLPAEFEAIAGAWSTFMIACSAYTDMRIKAFALEAGTSSSGSKPKAAQKSWKNLAEQFQENLAALSPVALLVLGLLELPSFYTVGYFLFFALIYPPRIALKLWRSRKDLSVPRSS
ncbi:MAG: CDP-alcohol phosphatidyltransferase family protein [Bdellovibrionales bacterium]|nr:CDP-alcohol phosphatidyltransferase family protein [Bdellovibrionales bacterium]